MAGARICLGQIGAPHGARVRISPPTALWLDRLGFIRLRHRQRLRRRALDLLPAPRMDDDAAENYFGAAATVRIGRCGELMRAANSRQ